jgi:hypothetical protein
MPINIKVLKANSAIAGDEAIAPSLPVGDVVEDVVEAIEAAAVEEVYASGKKKPKLNTDWVAVKNRYLQENLDPGRVEPYSLKSVSIEAGLDYGSVRRHAAKEKWKAELETRRQERDEAAIGEIQVEADYSEFEVRSRHIELAQLLQEKGLSRLKEIELAGDISVKDAIELVKLGVNLERQSIGIRDGSLFIGNINIGQFNWHDEADRMSDYLKTLDPGKMIELTPDADSSPF